MKAAFLYNFARFVQWPEADQNSPVRFCVYGKDPFGKLLDESLRDKNMEGRPLEIQRLSGLKDIEECHVLFVGASSDISSVLRQIGNHPILTVSETPGFTQMGGIINFVLQDQKVRFEINPQTAAAAGLKISSQLLRLALISKGGSS